MASEPSSGRPPATAGLRHVALFVREFEATERFYVELLGMTVEWRPDPDNVYLTSGVDNLALHRASPASLEGFQRLDHIGFILSCPADVDRWHEYLSARGVPISAPPRTHRDGARSFYCRDPDGTVVQMIYHPPLAAPAGG
ncbi:MAG: VOC family protein [Gammaproteobacteria bacterium]|jgi:catechol 2,3-dioxygenase-like lactoylglutathione lyase family enzyme|nr:VOC family protein [Gammaproteobacteria bacterium]